MKSIHCSHDTKIDAASVCVHLLEQPDLTYFQYFSGEGRNIIYICWKCEKLPDRTALELQTVCSACLKLIEKEGDWDGIVGKPTIVDRITSLGFEHRNFPQLEFDGNELLDIQPVLGSDESEWIGLLAENTLVRISLADPVNVTVLGQVESSPAEPFTALELSPDGQLVALFQPLGLYGVVMDLSSLRSLSI